MTRFSIIDLSVRYGGGRRAVTAVDRVSLAIGPGQTHGLVGESGSGKSSIARGVLGLATLSSGSVLLDDIKVAGAGAGPPVALRSGVQMVFQNPYASLNPRMTVGEAVEEAILVHRPEVGATERGREVAHLLELVGLPGSASARYPHQFSGGQRQRIAIARAISTGARVLILDEVTSALDVSVQANVLNLLRQLQRDRSLSFLFISHDLAVVRYMSDAVSVMYLSRIVETAPVEELFRAPRHPYTRALIDSLPGYRPSQAGEQPRLVGEIPDPRSPPSGCRFHTRCPVAARDTVLMERCRSSEPPRVEDGTHVSFCHLAGAPAPEVSRAT